MTAPAGPSFAHPRTRELADFLAARRAELRSAVEAVPPALRGRRPAAGRWSVAEVLEHLALLEQAVVRRLAPAFDEARAAGTREADTSSVLPRFDTARMRDRTQPIEAPEGVRPQGTLDADAAWTALEAARADLLRALAGADGLALGAVTRPHRIFGPIDLYQWVLAVGGHEARHALQIEEIGAAFAANHPHPSSPA